MTVSTPSRICLFGEHQDYLGLDVIALAIDLRFSATFTPRDDSLISIHIRDSKLSALNVENTEGQYEHKVIDLEKPIEYRSNRDYLRSTVNLLLREGDPLRGLDIRMDSTIPIGKGMCSSSTMIVVLIKALLESINHPDKDDRRRIAWLGYAAEVLEFGEPGGMMDHCTSAMGGMLHMNFSGDVVMTPIDYRVDGCFILFDSLRQKDTTAVLAASKIPTLEAIDMLREDGITSVRDFCADPARESLLAKLPEFQRRKLAANIANHRILLEALAAFDAGAMTPEKLGAAISRHQDNLREGLGISTPEIDAILETALANGALGGKVNGSGGGGCCYAYARTENAPAIMEAVTALGYPCKVLPQDTGVRIDS